MQSTTRGSLLYVNFNQDAGCIAVGLDQGFRIFHSDPLSERRRVDFRATNAMNGGQPLATPSATSASPTISPSTVPTSEEGSGIGIVEMLFRTNFLALVGGGRDPKFPNSKVMLWDDVKSKFVLELEFRSEVKAVRLRRDRLVVVLVSKVFIYTLTSPPQRLYALDTCDNDRGLVALCASATRSLLAVPGRRAGHIQLVDLAPATAQFNSQQQQQPSVSTAPVTPRSIHASLLQAHTSPLACLTMNIDGSLLATASEKGTLLRIFDTQTGKLVHELRRGSDHARIWSLAFSGDSTRIAVASDKGTVHVFNLDATASAASTVNQEWTSVDPAEDLLDYDAHETTETESSSGGGGASVSGARPIPALKAVERLVAASSASPSGNRQSSLSFMKDLLPKYFSSEWSFSFWHLPSSDIRCLVAFGCNNHTLFVVCEDGTFYKLQFDPEKGGECERVAYHRLLQLEQDD